MAESFCSRCGGPLPETGQPCPRCGVPSSAGRVVGGYRLLERLGAGGFGSVWRAEQVAAGTAAAVKLLHPRLGEDGTTVARFQREARALFAVRHPNVVDVFHFGIEPDGAQYLAMELVEGAPLRRVLRQAGRLERARALELTRQAAEGLHAAHRQGVVHRDLKPDNLIVARGADGLEIVKVVDFGIALPLEGDGAPATRLTTGGPICTPFYASPEQARGERVDARSDVYSLAVVLYEMLSGAFPYDANTDQYLGMLMAHLTLPAVPLRQREGCEDQPAALEELLLSALSKEPGERPASMEAFAAEVKALQTEQRLATDDTLGVHNRSHAGAAAVVSGASRERSSESPVSPSQAATGADQGPRSVERQAAEPHEGRGAKPPADRVSGPSEGAQGSRTTGGTTTRQTSRRAPRRKSGCAAPLVLVAVLLGLPLLLGAVALLLVGLAAQSGKLPGPPPPPPGALGPPMGGPGTGALGANTGAPGGPLPILRAGLVVASPPAEWGAAAGALAVVAEGPAAEGGVRPGDVILRVDARPVANPAALLAYLQGRSGSVWLQVMRPGQGALQLHMLMP